VSHALVQHGDPGSSMEAGRAHVTVGYRWMRVYAAEAQWDDTKRPTSETNVEGIHALSALETETRSLLKVAGPKDHP